MLRRKTVTLKAADLYWRTFCFREKPVTVNIRPTVDLRAENQRAPRASSMVQMPLL